MNHFLGTGKVSLPRTCVKCKGTFYPNRNDENVCPTCASVSKYVQEATGRPLSDLVGRTAVEVLEGRKDDAGKPRYDLLDPQYLHETARVLEYGARKYKERNWENGMSWGRPFAALMRHLWAWWGGEQRDPETGFLHLAHASCCLMFLLAYEKRKIGSDDRPTGGPLL